MTFVIAEYKGSVTQCYWECRTLSLMMCDGVIEDAVTYFGVYFEVILTVTHSRPGGRLNKKDRLTGYGDPHVKDKTSYRPSYL